MTVVVFAARPLRRDQGARLVWLCVGIWRFRLGFPNRSLLLLLMSQGHNRFWSGYTPYAKQNGGDYNFLIDNQDNIMGHLALPVDQSFWDFLMTSSKQWGLSVYEQDWLDDTVRQL